MKMNVNEKISGISLKKKTGCIGIDCYQVVKDISGLYEINLPKPFLEPKQREKKKQKIVLVKNQRLHTKLTTHVKKRKTGKYLNCKNHQSNLSIKTKVYKAGITRPLKNI